MKDRITELLLNTKREGIENLIEWMEQNGFFKAPCSTQYHLSKDGGLAEHSMNVYYQANSLHGTLENYATDSNSIVIVSLLHDIGKCGDFGKKNYVDNILKSGKRSESKPYATNKELLYVPHCVRSVKIISRFIELTEEEEHAILYHDGLYGDMKYSLSERPLQMLLHFADLWCSRVIEMGDEDAGSEI